MKQLIQKASKAVQMILAAPVKLPSKVTQVAKYIAVALGILEAIVPEKDKDPKTGEEGSGETAD